jgi:hypothetical protein
MSPDGEIATPSGREYAKGIECVNPEPGRRDNSFEARIRYLIAWVMAHFGARM